MGSPLRLTVVGPDAEAAWDEVVDEFGASDLALSRFREDAELVALDRSAGSGRPVSVGRRLERAVVAAERARRLTDGRFDPRILGPRTPRRAGRELHRRGAASDRGRGPTLAKDTHRAVPATRVPDP